MKKNISGFMLVETLIVSVFVLTTLIYLFVQFQRIDNSYATTFTYNTTDSLYRTNNIKRYILNNGFTTLTTAIITGTDKYIDLSACPDTYLTNVTYCQELVNALDVKTILFTDEDLTFITANLKNLYFISGDMKNFINYINFTGTPDHYRVIVEYENGTFGTLKIY